MSDAGTPAPDRPRLDSLRVRLLLTVVVVTCATAGAAGLLLVRVGGEALDEAFERRATSLARTLASNATFGVLTGSREPLDELLGNLLLEEDVVRARVLDRDGTPLAEAGRPASPAARRVRAVTAPVRVDAARERRIDEEFAAFLGAEPGPADPGGVQTVGTVEVTLSEASLARAEARVRSRTLLSAALLVLVGALAAWGIASSLLSPIGGLVSAVRAVGEGDLDRRVEETGASEVRVLAGAFNRMTEALRRHRQELRAALEELAQKERLASLGQLVAAVAHELRNPMGILLSSAQVVGDPAKEPAMREEAARYVEEEVRRLDRTLSRFLEFARPRPPVRVDGNVAEIAGRAVEACRQDPAAEGVAFEVDAPADLPAVAVDPDQLHQALLNVLLNACQAVGAGGTVTVALRSAGDGLQLRVEDTGPGVPEELRGRVFDPFFSTRDEGMGLGLATVFRTLDEHGGTVRVGRAPGGGASFELELPLTQGEER